MPNLSHLDSPAERLDRMAALGPRLAAVHWSKRLGWPMTLRILAQAHEPEYTSPAYRERAIRWAAGLSAVQ